MPERELPNFDDPDLKAALRRSLASEKAPAALRNRVEALFDAPPRATTARSFWQYRVVSVAAAAVVLICIGLAAWRFEKRTPALPEAFARDLVATHDHCCSLPDHHVLKGVPDDDFRLMTQKLREQLGFPALAATAGDGWKFYGASALCMVGPAHCAHLVFKQNGESLSIFSVALSSESWPDGKRPTDGERFANTQAGHPIISWVHNDTVYSVVGGSANNSLKLDGIAPVADRLRVAVLDSNGAGEDRTTVALR